jgi:hypothetical protein
LGVCTKGEELLGTPKSVLQAPEFAAGRGDQKKKAAAIEQFDVYGLGFG